MPVYNMEKKPGAPEFFVTSYEQFILIVKHHTAEALAEDDTIFEDAYAAYDDDDLMAFDQRVEFFGTQLDSHLPTPENSDDILTFVLWNNEFFITAPDGYDRGNGLAPHVIAYTNIYREAMSYLEESWREIVALAHYIRIKKGYGV